MNLSNNERAITVKTSFISHADKSLKSKTVNQDPESGTPPALVIRSNFDDLDDSVPSPLKLVQLTFRNLASHI